ncbi:MAG TPA: protein translocase subunit SecD [Gammaproteobacteria bacterium]|nr:protein translocase subunit SecD [Gammaproteobacteria bacterium]
MNQYPAWKYLLVITVLLVGMLYALPNLYGEDPALQVTSTRTAEVDLATQDKVQKLLTDAGIAYDSISLADARLLVRFSDTEAQLVAKDVVKKGLGRGHVVALNLAPRTPDWLVSLGAEPMYLGLDLRGGVHFLMEVDVDSAVKQAEERYIDDFRGLLRKNKVRYARVVRYHNEDVDRDGLARSGVEIKFKSAEARDQAEALIDAEYPDLELRSDDRSDGYYLLAGLDDKERREVRKLALKQNITTLRNRVNELGVSEPVIQQQGDSRIVVQLPGVQDTARAKEILGATATLEFRLADETNDVQEAVRGRVPPGLKLYPERDGGHVLLKNRVMLTGDYIIDASSGLDQQSGSPAVYITLDGKGASIFSKVTGDNIKKLMAVVFIENKTETRMVDGKPVKTRRTVEEVINVARIQDQLSKRFQITGLDSTKEAHNLALLLRAGALAAPIEIIEERTIGPSLGQENIDQGFMSVIIGFVLVLAFMAIWYRGFGLVANLALALNLVVIVAVLSIMQATLTLPGIAGIVLTVGMAVDANVLIFERIREELRNGISPQAAINAGYEKAFSTIADANITTLIAAVILYGFGTGPIKGFAITLSIGIMTSMFTAIMGTRAVVNLMYGGRRVDKLSI